MKKIVIVGIAATLISGILLSFIDNYGQYLEQKRMEEEQARECQSEVCGGRVLFTSYFFNESINYLMGGLAAGSIGIGLLVLKRKEIAV